MSDDTAATSQALACDRSGPHELRCMDLQQLIDARDKAVEQKEETDSRRSDLQSRWGWNKHGEERL